MTSQEADIGLNEPVEWAWVLQYPEDAEVIVLDELTEAAGPMLPYLLWVAEVVAIVKEVFASWPCRSGGPVRIPLAWFEKDIKATEAAAWVIEDA